MFVLTLNVNRQFWIKIDKKTIFVLITSPFGVLYMDYKK